MTEDTIEYPGDVEDAATLVKWLAHENESLIHDVFDWYHDDRAHRSNDRVTVRFPEGDLCNAPSRLMDAIQGTSMYVDHLAIEDGSCSIIDPANDQV